MNARTEGPAPTPQAPAPSGRGHPSGPRCAWASIALLILALVLLVFGFFYLLEPGPSVSSINSIATTLGLHLPATPSNPPEFRGWVGFTFAYMMGATACALMAALSRPPARDAYLNILMLLKGTSSLTGLGLFLAQAAYPFYLATFLTDGLIFLGVLLVRLHLTRSHPLPSLPEAHSA